MTKTYSLSVADVSPLISPREHGSLLESLEPRIAVEQHFEKLGHTHRHGRLYRTIEHKVTRPALKLGLQTMGIYARGQRNAVSPVVKRMEIAFPRLPDALDGFQILHLSDFHIDGTPALADALVPVVSRLRPDVCVMTGDYRFEDHGPAEPLYAPMNKIISAIQSRLGTFGILGNHDHSEMAFGLEKLGVRMLVNESVELENSVPLWLIGVDDPYDFRCDDLERALAVVPQNSFKLLLAHAPEIYDQAEREGVDLYLCGHTHAGQIRVPGIGAIRQNARCPRAYAAGHWRHGNMQGHTSAGVGCSGLPVRFGCPPEVALIELRAA